MSSGGIAMRTLGLQPMDKVQTPIVIAARVRLIFAGRKQARDGHDNYGSQSCRGDAEEQTAAE
jgi:hypothetical protein